MILALLTTKAEKIAGWILLELALEIAAILYMVTSLYS